MMKRKVFILCLLFLGLSISVNKVNASVKTGYNNITNVYFEGEGKLLIDYTKDEIKELSKGVSKKFFGTATSYVNYKRKIIYDGEIIFSKVNKSLATVDYNYKVDNKIVETSSYSKSGSFSFKTSTVFNKIKTTITAAISGEITSTNEKNTTTCKSMDIDIKIMPGRKVTLMTRGEAYVTLGYSKKYFLGITVKKGAWERIVIDTMYYELVEEVI